MRLLDRYILAHFGKNLLLTVVAATLLFLFQNLFSDLSELSHPFRQIFWYQILNTPQAVVQMAGPSCLLAILMTLTHLQKTNELTAFFSLGLGLRRILCLALFLLSVFSFMLLIFQNWVLPWSFQVRSSYYHQTMRQQKDLLYASEIEKIWVRSENFLISIQHWNPLDQKMTGLRLYHFGPHFQLDSLIVAQEAEPFNDSADSNAKEKDPKNQTWILKKGSVTTFQQDSDFPLTQSFASSQIVLKESPGFLYAHSQQIEGLNFGELFHLTQKMKSLGIDASFPELTFHSRVSLAFLPLVMCLLAFPFALTPHRQTGGTAKNLAFCLFLTAFYWLSYTSGLSLGKSGKIEPWIGAWLPSLFFTSFGLLMLIPFQKKVSF